MPQPVTLEMAAEVVAAFVSNNPLPRGELPALIQTIHDTLARLSAGVENSTPHVVEEEAEFVRALFRRYLEVGSVVRLKTVLDAENLRSPVRMSKTGRRTGGGLMSRGHLYWILSNPI